MKNIFSIPVVGSILTFVIGLAVPAFLTLGIGCFTGDENRFFYYNFPPILTVWNLAFYYISKTVLTTSLVPVPLFMLGLIRSAYVLFVPYH